MGTQVAGHQNCGICHPPQKNLKARSREEARKEITVANEGTADVIIDRWASDEQIRIARFTRDYREAHASDPEKFPIHMSLGDWDEQFIAWSASGEKL